MKSLFKGTGVALVTPFKNGNVDYNALTKVINHVVKGGVEFVVSLGTTGETPTLSQEEQFSILDFTIKQVDERIPVVAGVGGSNTKAIQEILQGHSFDGVSAILSSSPSYNKPTQEGIYQHFQAVGEASPLPVIIYNVPSRTGSNVTAETTLRLAESSNKFIAVKEASGDLRQCMEIVQHKPKDFLLLSGDDNMTLPMLSFGGDGVISVIANALPRLFSDLIRAGLDGDFTLASHLHFQMLEISDLLYVDGNPAGIKGLLEIMDICSKEVRLPLVPLSDNTFHKIKKLADNLLTVNQG